jgi:hypothetical protein
MAAAPQHSGVRRMPSTVILGMCPAPAQGQADITALYTARYGAPVAGQRIFVEAKQVTDGWFGPKKGFHALVPSI